MTLIELMAAIVLTGIMATAGAAAFGSIIDHRAVIRTATVDVERAAALREMLRIWIVGSTIQLQSRGVPGGRAGGAATRTVARPVLGGVTAAIAAGDEINFTTSAPTPSLSPSTRIRLFIDGDENTVEHGLTMEYQSSVGTPMQRLELDSTITTMVVEFLDRRTNRWFPSTESSTIQPLALRLSLVPPEGGSLPRLLQIPFVFRMGDAAQPVAGR